MAKISLQSAIRPSWYFSLELFRMYGIHYLIKTRWVKWGGYADFNNFIVREPRPHGLTKPIPYNQIITLTSLADRGVMLNWKHFFSTD